MRSLLAALATLTAGCQCQEYHLADLHSRHPDFSMSHAPTDGVGVPQAPRPRGEALPRGSVPRARLRAPRGATPAVPRPPPDDACAAPPAPVDTATPGSPYAAPLRLPGTCLSTVAPTWRSGPLVAGPKDADGPWGWLDVPKPGTYHLYGPPLSTGDVGLLRVPTVDRRGGRPVHANCGTDWLVAPPPAGTPEGVLVYLGTFALEAGPNPVQLRHACSVPEAATCGEGLAPVACEDGGVVLRGADVCVVAAE